VISKIVPDDEMPFIETNGKIKRTELVLNSLGVVNRLNSWQLYQVSINFICNKVAEKIETLKTNKEKEKLLFDIVKRFNTTQQKELKKYYDGLSKSKKEIFFKDIIDNGIYIHIPPLWEKEREVLFDRINQIYKDYAWIKPYEVFVNKFGRKIKMLNDLVVAEKYLIKMKQTSKKGFSARSTGSISKQGLPSKSSKAKNNLEIYSKTPIRLGIDENINTCIGSPSDLIAKLHLFYRSSVVGRKELSKELAETIKSIGKFKYTPEFKNRNVEILQAYLKCLGYALVFDDEYYDIEAYDSDITAKECPDGSLFIGNDYQYKESQFEEDVRKHMDDDEYLIGTAEEIEEKYQKKLKLAKLKENYYVIGDVDLEEL
jgi:hypothetical protein